LKLEDYEALVEKTRLQKGLKRTKLYVAHVNEYWDLGYTFTLSGLGVAISQEQKMEATEVKNGTRTRKANWQEIYDKVKKEIVSAMELGKTSSSKQWLGTKEMLEN